MSLVVPPYPPPRYTKDEPEVSAWLKRADSPPDYESTGVKYHCLADQPAHFHRAMSEAFFVLSGTMKLYDGTEWADGRQGDFLYVPPGGIHGFRNEADECSHRPAQSADPGLRRWPASSVTVRASAGPVMVMPPRWCNR